MENFWATFMLLLGVSASTATLPTPYDQAVASAVEAYNQEPGLKNAFRLLEAAPQTGWNPSAQSVQQLKFSIKETTCPVTETSNISQCDYKDDGLVKDCTGYFPSNPGNSKIRVSCDTAAQKPVRVTRFRFIGRLLRGIGRGIGFWNSNQ